MEICRLCLLNQQQLISVFSKLESNRDVANIISKHVGEVCINEKWSLVIAMRMIFFYFIHFKCVCVCN